MIITWMLDHLNWSVIIIGSLFTVGLFFYYFKINESKTVLSYVPNVWTSLGILGTFVSIVSSLEGMNFAQADSNVVEKLVKNIVPAFETSIIGIIGAIFSSIVIKIIFAKADSKEDERISRMEDKLLIAVGDIKREGAALNRTILAMNKTTNEFLTKAYAALTANFDELLKAHSAAINEMFMEEKNIVEEACQKAIDSFSAESNRMEASIVKIEENCVAKIYELSVSVKEGCKTISEDSIVSIDNMQRDIIQALSNGLATQMTGVLGSIDNMNNDFLGKIADLNDKLVDNASRNWGIVIDGIAHKADSVVSSFVSLAQSEQEKLEEILKLYGEASSSILNVASIVETKVDDMVNEMKTGFAGNIQKLKELNSELSTIVAIINSSNDKYELNIVALEKILNDINEVEIKLSSFLSKFVGTGAEVQAIYEKLDKISEMNYALNFRIAQLRKGYRSDNSNAPNPIICSKCNLEIDDPMANFCPKCGNNLNDEFFDANR